MKTITSAMVVWVLECLPEETPVRGNAMASGDDAVDKKAEDSILLQLESGNLWAWCTVKLTGRFNGLEVTDCLGCCSYKSEEDFKHPQGYYPDMMRQVLDELNAQAQKVCVALEC